MPIIRPSNEEEVEKSVWEDAKKYIPTPEEVARFALSGAGMVGGGIVGSGASPVAGTVAGGALGYAVGQKVGDIAFGPRREVKEDEGVAEAVKGEAIQTGKDIGEGLLFSMVDPLFRVAGKGLYALERGVGSLMKKGVKGTISDVADRHIRRSAANKIAESVTRGGEIGGQIERNIGRAERLEEEMGGGIRFTPGEKGGDPNLLNLERAKTMQPGFGTAKRVEFETERGEAIREYINKNITGKGDVANFLSSIGKEGERLRGAVREATKMADGVATKLGGRGEQEVGSNILEKARSKRIASSMKAEELYKKVPDEMEIESEALWNKVKEMFGSYDELTQRITATPTKPMGKVQQAMGRDVEGNIPIPEDIASLRQAMDSGLVDSSGRIMATTSESPVRNLTMKEMRDFRSQISTSQRMARASKDDELAWKYGELKRAVNQSLNDTIGKGEAEGVEALKNATDYYSRIHVPTFKHGATSRVLARTSTGEQRVVDSSVGGAYFKPGKGGAEAADDFIRTFGNEEEARGLIRDYASQSMLKASRNTVTGDISTKGIQKWQYQHQTALKRLGLWNEFGPVERGRVKSAEASLEKASMLADRAREMEAAFNKSALVRSLEVDPDRYINSVLMTGAGKKQAITRLKRMVEIAKKGSEPKAALDGLRTAIGENFERNMAVTAGDLSKGNMESYHKMHKFWNDMREPIKESGLYSREQIKAWDDIHKTLQVISRQGRPVVPKEKGVGEMVGKAMAGTASIATHRLGTYGIVRHAFSMVDRALREQIDDAIVKAMYDPRYAETVMGMVRNTGKLGASGATREAVKGISRLDEATGRITGWGEKARIPSLTTMGRYVRDEGEKGKIVRPAVEDEEDSIPPAPMSTSMNPEEGEWKGEGKTEEGEVEEDKE